ncbi:MAG: single-stranded DNA-binding protein [Bacillota bacterium]|nr:single-stranded DNA-binding protein [Bacillota bacterium]
MKNNVTLIGRLVKDADLRYTPNGVAVATVSLAVQRDFKNANNETECDFPNVVVWKKAAENLANHCKKGDLIGIQGRLQTRSYDDTNGKKVYVTEVVSQSVDFLRVKAWENGNGQPNQGNSQNSNNGPTRGNNQSNRDSDYNDPFRGNGSIDINDDDLPF